MYGQCCRYRLICVLNYHFISAVSFNDSSKLTCDNKQTVLCTCIYKGVGTGGGGLTSPSPFLQSYTFFFACQNFDKSSPPQLSICFRRDCIYIISAVTVCEFVYRFIYILCMLFHDVHLYMYEIIFSLSVRNKVLQQC